MADIATNTLQIGGNNLILQDAAVRSSLANAYSASSTYAVGDMVLKDGQLYECNTAISTAEAWTAAHWTAVTVGGELSTVKDGLTGIHNVVMGKDAFENGAFGAGSGKVNSDYRIRLKNPVYVEKGTELYFSIGNLYSMVWEMSSSATTGGNVIVSKPWGAEKTYYAQNDCWLMISFSKTSSGATQRITVDDFASDYYVYVNRLNGSAIIYTASQALTESEKEQARGNIGAFSLSGHDRSEYDMAQLFSRNLANPDDYTSGYYKHGNPLSPVGTDGNASHLPKIRIIKGLTYSFRNVYAYFCSIIYDDGTISPLTNTASPATTNITITPTINGYAYVTVNSGWLNSAMVVESYAPYNGTYFTGYDTGLSIYPRVMITPSNYSTDLPTLASARSNTIYKIVSTLAMTVNGTMTDVPRELTKGQRSTTLFNIGTTTVTGCVQILFVPQTGNIYMRTLNETSSQVQYWTDWLICGKSEIVVAKDNSGDYSSLTEAIAEAIKHDGTHVYVKEGAYDIIAEYKAMYGNDFFDTYTSTVSTTNPGIILSNGVVVEFAPNAYVVCDYQGNNDDVTHLFAPFNSGAYGFTLINANVTSRNVRYSVHDERARATDYYHNKYIGCHFNHDKGTGTGYRQTIGGGLGKNGLIEIENCTFENPSDTGFILSWHNCVLEGARSQILIRNSMVKGSVRFSYYGDSTLVSTMMVTGCKLFAEPQKTQETSGYTTDNVEILSWNNVIGTF